VLLQQLIGKSVNSGNGHAPRVQKASRKKTQSPKVKKSEDTDSRCVQVKSAVRRTEKRAFEELAIKRETTLSDLIRDFLLEEAKSEGLL
jgi:hypothetical protein